VPALARSNRAQASREGGATSSTHDVRGGALWSERGNVGRAMSSTSEGAGEGREGG
jgi:hypothetical protein